MICIICGRTIEEFLPCLEGAICMPCYDTRSGSVVVFGIGPDTYILPLAGFWKEQLEKHGPGKPFRRSVGTKAIGRPN